MEHAAPAGDLQGDRETGHADGDVAAAAGDGDRLLLLLHRGAADAHAPGSAAPRVACKLGEERGQGSGGK